MSQEVTKIKKRISSVSGALKVTSAMKLVSTVKLKKWKNKMLSSRDYTDYLKSITDTVLAYAKKAKSPFSKANEETDKNLYIVVSSTLGLCGSYNNNIFKLADVSLKEKDDAIILGNKGIIHYENGSFTKILGFEEYNSIENTALINTMTLVILFIIHVLPFTSCNFFLTLQVRSCKGSKLYMTFIFNLIKKLCYCIFYICV